jgi:hypothetical protein
MLPPPDDLTYWRGYFKDRVRELRAIQSTPWGFCSASMLLEVLGKLARGTGKKKFGRVGYVAFVRYWLPQYDHF